MSASATRIPQRLREILSACAAGMLPPNVALMHLYVDAESESAAEEAISCALGDAPDGAPEADRLSRLRSLHRRHGKAFGMLRGVLQAVGDPAGPGSIPKLAEAFDAAVEWNPAASVALYSLGDAKLLEAATREIAEQLRQWRLISPRAVVLDLGCGTGRLVEALREEVAFMVGIDISAGMLREARRRGGWDGASFVRVSGQDIGMFRDCAFDLVVAADSFPYMVTTGVAARHIEEAGRILKDSGSLVILNFSYGGSAADDRCEIARLAQQYGLSIVRNGERPFALWDGLAFQLRKERPRPIR